MEFKKINEDKFQCLLYEEDLEYNNITLDDFFRNDTERYIICWKLLWTRHIRI